MSIAALLPASLLAASLLACTDKGGTDSGPAGGDTAGEDSGSTGETGDTAFADHPMMVDGKFYVVAHRGGALLAPEETMLAFDTAVDVGADVLELDVHSSSDGYLVVMHDDTVDRTTDGTGAVKSMTLSEIQALDAGYWFTTDGGKTYPHRGTGLTVPTLDEVLAAHPSLLFNIEIKQQDPPIVDDVIAAVRDAGVADQVVLGSFTDAVVRDIQETAPDILTAMGLIEGFGFYTMDPEDAEDFEATTPFIAAPVSYSGIELSAEVVDKAHVAGLKVHAWTVNEADEMDRVMAMGVDGIITDDPATLRAKADAR